MEYWVRNRDDILIFIFNAAHLYKIRFSFNQPNIPTFHYSSTPWHLITLSPVIYSLVQ